MPMTVEPLRNCTEAIEPPVSLAVALRLMVAGAVKVAPLAGLVRLTVGELPPLLPPPLHVMLVGVASLFVHVPWKPNDVLEPAATLPL